MTGGHSGAFLAGGHGGVAWDRAREQLANRPIPEGSWERLREEMAVQDLLSRYALTFDSRDLDGIMRFFADDCVITNPHGTFAGAGAIRTHYEDILRQNRHTFHLWANAVVRLSGDLREGRIATYFLAVLERDRGSTRTVGGLLVDDVTKTETWRIQARSTSFELTASLSGAATRDTGD